MKITEEVLRNGEWIEKGIIFRYRPTDRKATVIYKLIKCKYCGEKCFITPITVEDGFCSISCASKLKNFKDLTGLKFGKLSILSKTKQNKRGRWYWLCQCDCGKTKEVQVSKLINGETRSCGCLRYLCGYKDGYSSRPEVTSYLSYADKLKAGGEEVRRNPNEFTTLQVKCKYCGIWFSPSHLQTTCRVEFINSGKRRESYFYCSRSCKIVCPSFGRKEKDYLSFMKSDKIPLNREVQPELRKMVLERDNWTCQKCEKYSGELHCHHYEGIEQNPIESADLDNCVTLCVDCHKFVHTLPGCSYYDLRRCHEDSQ